LPAYAPPLMVLELVGKGRLEFFSPVAADYLRELLG
jgi:hypothetical protein